MGRRSSKLLLWTEELLNGLLWKKDLLQFVYEPKTSFIDRKSSEGLLLTKVHLQIFYGPNTLSRSSMDQSPYKSLLWANYLLKVFYGPTSFCKTSLDKIPSEVLLWIENLLKGSYEPKNTKMDFLMNEEFVVVFYGQKTFLKSFIDLFELLLWIGDLFKVFYEPKTFLWSSIVLRRVRNILYIQTKDRVKVFQGPWSP